MRAEMDADPFYHKCCITGDRSKIEWHHVWIYAGKQINEKWAILPVSKYIHDLVDKNASVRRHLQKISLNRAEPADLAKYPKKDWHQIKLSLE